jgi:hypothetical protein
MFRFFFTPLLLLTFFSQLTAQSVGSMGIKLGAGINPNTVLDVNGSASYREGTALTLANGANSNVALSEYSFFRITGPTAAFSITGFTGGVDGRVLTIINATTQTLSLSNQTTSLSANQINTGGSTISLAANGVATLIYNASLAKWVVTGTSGSSPNFYNITNGSYSDSLVVINNGEPRKVPPSDYIETYAWGLDGNAGTTAGTNFLGTTDAQDLVIKANNTEGVRVKATTGFVGLNVTSPSVRFAVSNNTTVAATPADAIAQFTNSNNTDTEIHIDTYGNGVNDDPAIVFRRARGTAAAGLTLQSEDPMGRLSWWGHNGTNFVDQAAKFEASAGENWTTTANGSHLDFWTTPNGSTIYQRNMRLSEAGNLGIGFYLTPLSTARLHVEAIGTNHAFYAPLGTNYNHIAGRTAFGRASTTPTTTFVGTAADAFWHFQDSVTSFGSNIVEGIGVKLKIVPTAASTGLVYGINSRVHTAAYNSQNFSVAEAINSDFRHYGTGTIATSYGLIARSVNIGTGRINKSFGVNIDIGNYGGTVDSMWGIQIAGGQFGTMTNAGVGIGLQITDMTATTGYGIWQGGNDDSNFFNGNIGISMVNPSVRLHVNNYTAIETVAKFSNNSIGTSNTDGFDVGIDATGNATLYQYENLPMLFKVNNQNSGRIGINGETYLGMQAGNAVTSGQNNTFIGHQAGATGTTTWGNTAVGYRAAGSSTTALQYTAVGDSALFANTTGNYNTAIGYQALKDNTTGNLNTAVGQANLQANTTGSGNTAIGQATMALNTTGNNNTALGQSSLFSNTTGGGNTAVGVAALYLNTGSNNVAVGGAMYSNTTGNNNTATGVMSMNNFQTGSNNVAYGWSALTGSGTIANNTASNNTAIGYNALGSNSSGGNNAALGFQALQATTTGTGNVGVGYQAGLANQTGTNNTFIGNGANASNINFTNATAIGYNASVGASNSLVLGNSANVGIGTSIPINKLDVEGGVAVGANYSGTRTAPTNGMIIEGNVGINNYDGGAQYSSPTYNLSVNRYHTDAGSNTPIGLLAYNNGTSPSTLGASAMHFQTARGTYASPTALQSGNLMGVIGFGGHDGTSFSFPNFATIEVRTSQNWTTTAKGTYMTFNTTPNSSTTSSERIRIDQSGFVGIGITAPTNILHINGQGRATNTAWTTTSDRRLKDVEGRFEYGLNELMQINTYRFRYKKDNPLNLPSDRPFQGVMAQELRTVIPEAVQDNPDGYLTVNSDPVIWTMLNSIKDLKKENDDLKAQVEQLKAEVLQKDKNTEGVLLRLEKLEAALSKLMPASPSDNATPSNGQKEKK